MTFGKLMWIILAVTTLKLVFTIGAMYFFSTDKQMKEITLFLRKATKLTAFAVAGFALVLVFYYLFF